jgi:hypothetical protein
LPLGTIAVWDSHFSNDYGLEYSALISDPTRWRILKEFNASIPGTLNNTDSWIVVFRKERL